MLPLWSRQSQPLWVKGWTINRSEINMKGEQKREGEKERESGREKGRDK